MRLMAKTFLYAMAAMLLGLGSVPGVQAQAQHSEYPFQVLDYNDCTGEEVLWTVVIREVLLDQQNPAGQGQFLSFWLWEGIVEGQQTGYVWTTKGQSPYVETYSLENSLTGGFIQIENSVLQPASPGAPRIKLDVNLELRFNADGELVVERATYTYDCRSH